MTYCHKDTGCKKAAGGFKFPNGLARGRDGLIYVPNSLTGMIHIFKVLPNHELEKVDEVFAGYSIDNLNMDRDGDFYIAAFPRGIDIFMAYEDPYNAYPAATALRLRKVEGKYVVEKVIEDGDGEALPAATTVIHDAKTGRLFFSSEFSGSSMCANGMLTFPGVISPFISVCEPKK